MIAHRIIIDTACAARVRTRSDTRLFMIRSLPRFAMLPKMRNQRCPRDTGSAAAVYSGVESGDQRAARMGKGV